MIKWIKNKVNRFKSKMNRASQKKVVVELRDTIKESIIDRLAQIEKELVSTKHEMVVEYLENVLYVQKLENEKTLLEKKLTEFKELYSKELEKHVKNDIDKNIESIIDGLSFDPNDRVDNKDVTVTSDESKIVDNEKITQ